jgi:hypothetical protein
MEVSRVQPGGDDLLAYRAVGHRATFAGGRRP